MRSTAKLLALDELARGRTISVRCASSSMEPAVLQGDRVLARPARRGRAGEVVVLAGRSDFILHRVLWSNPRLPWLVHSGDRTGSRPAFARQSAVVARALVPRRQAVAPKRWLGLSRAVKRSGAFRLRRLTQHIRDQFNGSRLSAG